MNQGENILSYDKTIQKNYQTLTIDLTLAQTDVAIDLPGVFDYLTVISLTQGSDVSIRINELNADLLDLTVITTVETPMRRLYVTNSAQVGNTLVLGLGSDAKFVMATSFAFKPLRVWSSATPTMATVAAYVTLHSGVLGQIAGSTAGNQKCTILLTETAGNDVKYSVDVSLDNILWINLKTDVVLLANQSAYETLSDPWLYLRTQVKDNVAGVHGSVSEKRYGYTIT